MNNTSTNTNDGFGGAKDPVDPYETSTRARATTLNRFATNWRDRRHASVGYTSAPHIGGDPPAQARSQDRNSISSSNTSAPGTYEPPSMGVGDRISVIKMSQERENVERGEASILQPTFMIDANLSMDATDWVGQVLPEVSSLTFEIESLPDLEHFRKILASERELPQLWRAVRKVSFPKFYWFSGIMNNRTSNPYLDSIQDLLHLEVLSLTFHTAGLTGAIWRERERMQMEREQDIERSKELKAYPLREVVQRYKLDDIFKLKALTVLNLECIDTELVRHNVKASSGDPTMAFRDLGTFFKDGFRRLNGQVVQVKLTITPISYT
ncbi:hypothetical protein N0V90_004913 [Kalmusia sp. IMI 367209]|nr:hypothetical protein N0V90_004913 [Kalmusia sp. IMI 367209]